MEFVAHFQGIHMLRHPGSNGLYGYEALLRGPHGTSLENPANIFSEARNRGRLPELDLQSFKLAARTFASNDPGGFLFVNLFPETFSSAEMAPESFLQFLREIGLPPARLVIELVEDQRMSNACVVRQTLEAMAQEGVRFALDDFGAGVGDLERWVELEPHIVKVDRALLKNIATDRRRQQLLKSIEFMVEGTSSMLLCEGVESTEDAFWLNQNTDILLCQGYHFSRPTTIESIQKVFDTPTPHHMRQRREVQQRTVACPD